MKNLEAINQSKAGLDYFFQQDTSWLSDFNLSGYPVVVIFWNLLLLVVPWLLCSGLYKYWRVTKWRAWYHKLGGLGLASLWLLFIPNAAYIITDVRHVARACPLGSPHYACVEGAWIIMVFFTYAVLGWLAFVWLVRQMRQLIKKVWQEPAAQIYETIIIPLIALGVLLGLLNRWNSWEMFVHPQAVLATISLYFTNLAYFINWLLFSLFLYILYWLGNLVFGEWPKIKIFGK